RCATPHDLRRTHGGTITKLGFGREAMNRIQNHKEGGIASVYDRFEYSDSDLLRGANVSTTSKRVIWADPTIIALCGARSYSRRRDFAFQDDTNRDVAYFRRIEARTGTSRVCNGGRTKAGDRDCVLGHYVHRHAATEEIESGGCIVAGRRGVG